MGIVNRPNHENYLKNYNVEFADSSEFITFTQVVYKSIEDIINVIRQEYPENAFRLMLNTASNMNSLKYEPEIFSENCFSLMNDSLSILQDTKLEADKKLGLLLILISTTCTIRSIPKEKIMTLITSLVQFSQTLPKRSEQTL